MQPLRLPVVTPVVLALALLAVAPGCRLVDQRTFDPALRARLAPKPPPAAPAPPKGPAALATIRFEQDVDYLPALRAAVRQAQARKPDVRFDVVTVVSAAGTTDQQIARVERYGGDARRVAADIQAMGIDPGQVALGARVEPDLKSHEVRVYVE